MFTVHSSTGAILSTHDDIIAACDALHASVHAVEVRRASDGAVMRYYGPVRRDAVVFQQDWRKRRRKQWRRVA
jgi:hypothetical protein